MRSLKITLTLVALVAVFFVTVSGQSSDVNNEQTTYEVQKDEFKMIASGVKKNKKPSNQAS